MNINARRLFCIILCLVFLCQGITGLAKDYPDTIGEDCEKAADVLLSLGIMYPMEDSNFQKDTPLTRSEAVVSVMRLINFENVTKPATDLSQSYFADIEPYYWALEDINFAYDCGYISMPEDKMFRPEDVITYGEFTKILLCALEYDLEADEKGGYPTGYMKQAKFLEILSNGDYNEETEVTRAAAAEILYNALGVTARVLVNNGTYTRYESRDTVLEEYFKIQKRRGIVTANEITSISGGSVAAEGCVSVDYKMYEQRNCDISDLLGLEVEYYVDFSTTRPTIVYATELGMENKVVTLSGRDSDYVYNKNIGEYVAYTDGGREKRYTLSKSVDLIYNGKLYVPEAGEGADMTPRIGYVTLIDNNGDSQYDIANIKKYESYVYSAYNSFNEELMLENPYKINSGGSQVTQNTDKIVTLNISDNFDHKIDFVGENIAPLDNLRKNTIVSVAMSMNSDYYEAIVSTKYISGAVESIKTEGNYKLIYIGGNPYRLYNDNEATDEITERSSGVYYLDYEDNIIFFEDDGSVFKYGYMQAVKREPGSMSEEVNFRIFTQSGEFEVYKAAKTIYIDDYPCKTEKEIKDKLNGGAHQLIRYRFGKENEINYIDTLAGYTTGDGTMHHPMDVNREVVTGVDENGKDIKVTGEFPIDGGHYVRYYDDTDTIGDGAGANTYMGGAIIFVVPTKTPYADDEYRIITKAFLMDAERYKMSAYCTEVDFNTEAIVIDAEDDNIKGMRAGTNNKMMIVEKAYTSMDNETGESYIEIEGKISGTSATQRVFQDAEDAYAIAKGLDSGDVYMFAQDVESNIVTIEKVYSYKDDIFYGYASTQVAAGEVPYLESNYHTRYRVISGYIKDRVGSLIYLDNDDVVSNPKVRSVYSLESAKVYKFEPNAKGGGVVSTITNAELTSYKMTNKKDMVIIRTVYGKPAEVYVPYRETP